MEEVIHSLERDPRAKGTNLVFAGLRQDGVAAHENPEEQTERRALCEWISPTIEQGVEIRDDDCLEEHRQDPQWDDRARSGESAQARVDVLEERKVPTAGDNEGQDEVSRCR